MFDLLSVCLFACMSIFILCAWWLAIWIKFFKYYLATIPGPTPLPIIGNVLQTGASPIDVLRNMSKLRTQYGPIFKTMFAFKPVIVVSDADWMKFICSSSKILHKSFVYKFMDNWIGEGLLTSGGKKWISRRKIISPAYYIQMLYQFTDVFNRVAEHLANVLEANEGEIVDVSEFTNLATLDTICETAMGVSVNALDNKNSDYVKAIRQMAKIIIERAFDPIQQFKYTYYLTKNYYKEQWCLKIIHQYTMNVIKQRRAEHNVDNRIHVKPLSNEDLLEEADTTIYSAVLKRPKKKLAFLDLLFDSTIKKKLLSDDDIREEVDTFMFAGHDTVSKALNFTTYILSQYPEVQEKVFQEQHEIFGTNKSEQPSNEAIKDMRYLDLVIKETLRLYPPVPMFAREITQDVQFGSQVLPKGLTVLMNVYELHRDPKYFTDPEKFDPERFIQGKQQEQPFTYMPFSAGPRNCIGQKFAQIELKCMVSRLIRQFKILPVSGFKPKLSVETVLVSTNGIKVKLQSRN